MSSSPSSGIGFFRRASAATVLFVILAVFALLGGSVAAVWRGFNTFERERQAVLDRDAMYSRTLSRSVHLFLADAQTAVSTLAAETGAQAALDFATLQPMVKRFAEQNVNSFISMYVIGTDGVEIADYFPNGIDDADRVAGVGVDLRDRPYLRKALNERRAVVSEAVIGRSTKRPVVVVAVPVIGPDGEVRAVAAGSLDLARLEGLALNAVGNSEQMPVIVDSLGQVVVHRTKGAVPPLTTLGQTDPAQKALAGGVGAVPSYRDADGNDYSAAYEHVPDFDWAVWVARDAADLGTVVGQAVRDALLTFAAALMLGGLAFALVAHFLFLPLRRLAAQMERVATGDLSARVNLSGTLPSREMNELAERFSDMARRVREMNEQLKNDFLFRTIHDIRSPLNVIRTVTAELREGVGTDEKKPDARYLTMIEEATSRMMKMVENLLSVAKGEQSDASLQLQPVEISTVIEQVAAGMRPTMEERGITFSHDITSAAPVRADVASLREVCENLLSNAVKYNRDAGSVAVTYVLNENDVRILFTDEGLGIPPDALPKLFVPYFRAASRDIQGTGLGLYIVKCLVEKMDGTVTVSSTQGVGTTFTVTLPRAAGN